MLNIWGSSLSKLLVNRKSQGSSLAGVNNCKGIIPLMSFFPKGRQKVFPLCEGSSPRLKKTVSQEGAWDCRGRSLGLEGRSLDELFDFSGPEFRTKPNGPSGQVSQRFHFLTKLNQPSKPNGPSGQVSQRLHFLTKLNQPLEV